jgi:hypothetical protein
MREIVQELRVSEALDAAAAEFPRVHDAMRGLEWRLARRPKDAVSRDQYLIYRQKGFPTLDIPDIVVLYRYENEQVNIVGIHVERSR